MLRSQQQTSSTFSDTHLPPHPESELPPPPPEETGIGCPLMSASAIAKIILRTEGIANWPSNDSVLTPNFRLCLKEFYSPVLTDKVHRNPLEHYSGQFQPVGLHHFCIGILSSGQFR